MVTKSNIVTTFNEIFESNKAYKDLSIYEKLYALIALNINNSNAPIDINDNLADILTELELKPNSTDTLNIQGISNGTPVITKGVTESISRLFMTADDRITTITYTDTTKQTISSITYTSVSVTALTTKTQLTITFSNPTSTSDRYTYVLT